MNTHSRAHLHTLQLDQPNIVMSCKEEMDVKQIHTLNHLLQFNQPNIVK